MTESPSPVPTCTARRCTTTRRLLAAVSALTSVIAATLGIAALTDNAEVAAPQVAAPEVAAPQETTAAPASDELEQPGGLPGAVEPTDEEATEDPFAGMSNAEIEALSDEELAALFEKIDWRETDWDDDWDDDADWDKDDIPLGTFAISGSSLDPGDTDATVTAQAQEIWDRFTTLIPADQRTMISGFELLREESAGGHVYPDSDPTNWVLGISLGLGDDLDFTLIHEFGHLLTLQATEVPPGDDTGSCTTYFTGEGCALQGSTFAEFVARFWPESLRNQVNQLQETLQETGDWDGFDAFYSEHQDNFVTEYAPFNPAEDLAETFATFVMDEQPTGNTVANQKVQFLWSDADMVSLRDQIRSAL